MKTFLKYLLLVAAVVVPCACEQSVGLEEKEVIVISQESFDYGCDGGSDNLVINSYCDWSASCDESWVKIEHLTGEKGIVETKITVEANPATKERTAVIFIKNEQYGIDRKINIAQEPRSVIMEDNLVAFVTELSKTVKIESAVPWKAECDASWLTLVKNGDNLLITVQKNLFLQLRTTTINIKRADNNELISSIEVVQSYFGLQQSKLDFKLGASTQNVTVETDIPWVAECEESWVTLVKNGNVLSVSVKENYLLEEREATINFKRADNGDILGFVKLSQGKSSFLIQQTALNFGTTASVQNVIVETNISWVAECAASWVTLVKNGNNLSVSVSENTLLEERVATVVIKRSGSNDILGHVQIKQTKTDFAVFPSTLDFKDIKSDKVLAVYTNISWRAECNASWVTCIPNGNSLTVTVERNENRTERKAVIVFKRIDNGAVLTSVDVTQAIATTGSVNGYDFVDLGLSSGLLWATCNVGASEPEENGDYYAWGETSVKSSYTLDNSLTQGLSLGDISANHSYDAAASKWGSTWRMPKEKDMEELLFECDWAWTTQNGVNGYKVTGPNGNSIFLPNDGAGMQGQYSSSYYWTSSPNGNQGAVTLSVSAAYNGLVSAANRFFGYCIRPVCK